MLRKTTQKPIPKLFGLRPARKQPKLLDRLLLKISRYFSRKTPVQQVNALHGRVTAAFRGELAGVLASALLAKKTLDTTRQVELPFPDALFEGTVPLDAAGRATLLSYVAALEEFRDQCIDAGMPLTMATATGVEVWMASAYGLLFPELKDKVSETWMRMGQVQSDLGEATKLLLRREPSEIDRVYFHYRPKALMG